MAFDHLVHRFRKAPLVLLSMAFAIGLAGEAAAESAFCRTVRADYERALRSSGGGGGGGGSVADLGRLRRQLADAQNDARRAGCRKLFGKPGKGCGAIESRISKIQRDISRARGGGGSFASNNTRANADRLRSILRRNGCDAPSSRGGEAEYASSGYRTLCVRTCDGYYFPINFSSSRSRFKIDEAVCQSMYGGAAAELYYHSNGAPSDTAVSLKGEPLSNLGTAFAYRHFYSPSCQGQLQRGLAYLGEAFIARASAAMSKTADTNQAPTRAPALLPTPVPRIAAGQDPETLANLAGRFTVEPVEIGVEEEMVEVASVPAAIRKLGPDYYYTPPIAIEALRNPPQTGPAFTLIGSAHAGEADEDLPGRTTVQ
jgi:Protein of unknown function (DUF2865)